MFVDRANNFLIGYDIDRHTIYYVCVYYLYQERMIKHALLLVHVVCTKYRNNYLYNYMISLIFPNQFN